MMGKIGTAKAKTNRNPHGLFIGQVLHCPPHHRSCWEEFKVVKIGTVWATLQAGSHRGYRCEINTLKLDCGGYSPRQLYKSREAYEQQAALNLAWRYLAADISTTKVPEGITLEDLAEIRDMLNLPPRKEK